MLKQKTGPRPKEHAFAQVETIAATLIVSVMVASIMATVTSTLSVFREVQRSQNIGLESTILSSCEQKSIGTSYSLTKCQQGMGNESILIFLSRL